MHVVCVVVILQRKTGDRKHVGIDSIQNFIKFVEKQFSLQIYETQHVSKESIQKHNDGGVLALIVAD